MALVKTDESGRVLYAWVGPNILREESKASLIEVPDASFESRPETQPWENAVAYLTAEGDDIVWAVEELPEDSEEQIRRRLADYEAPGEHFAVNPRSGHA